MSKLSNGCLIAWQIAGVEAEISQHQYIEKEHILIGILSIEKKIRYDAERAGAQTGQELQLEHKGLVNVLGRFGIDAAILRRDIRQRMGKGNYRPIEKMIHRSEACKEAFERGNQLAKNSREITCLHLLAAILEEPANIIASALKFIGIELSALQALAVAYGEEGLEIGKRAVVEKPAGQGPVGGMTPFLDRYGRNLNKEARDGRLGPFIGRRKELLQVIQTLARRSKNNPVLVGEAGVGKTAIVEALAIRIVAGKDPRVLAGKRIIELNFGALVGGTKYRGEFEERLSRIIEEARANPEIILFIDEIHNVVGAGRVEGGMDAANLLKPALARGDMRCIGATTIGEYRRYT